MKKMIYQYSCEKCGEIEIDQRMIDNALKSCPTCKSPIQRIITGGTGFLFSEDKNKHRGYKGRFAGKAKGRRNYTGKDETPHRLDQKWIENNT